MGETLHILRIPVILNSQAGGGSVAEEEIRSAFAAHGIVVEIHEAGKGFEELIRVRVTAGDPIIVVGGGDGSLHTAAGILAGTSSSLGILPLGTLNHFAKDLGLPLDVAGAVAVIAGGNVRTVDVGEANGVVFVNNASLGIYPTVVRTRDDLQRRLGKRKWSAYATAIVRSLLNYRLLSVRVRVGDHEHARKTPFVFIGNNPYLMDGLDIGSRSDLEGGVLSLYMARREGPVSLLLLAVRAIFGRLRQADDFEEFHAAEVEVETRRVREHVGLDGEVAMLPMPLRCRIRPKALRVLAPAS